MGQFGAVISCLLLSVGAVTAQKANTERLLPQWLTGLIAVAVFLFLAFVAFLMKRAWCEETSRRKTIVELVSVKHCAVTNENTYETTLDMVRSRDDSLAYDNPVVDYTENKVTSM